MNDLDLYPINPVTGERAPFHPVFGFQALGLKKNGDPIWPIMGGSAPTGHPAINPPPTDPPAGPPSEPPATDPTDPPDRGFPPDTPIAEMTDAERANYFKFHDRRKSDTLKAYQGITPEQALQWKQEAEEARRQQMQPSERALEDARSEASAAAAQQAAEQWAPQLAEAVVSQFVTDEKARPAVMAGLNPMTFVKDGKFDKDALIGHLTGLAAAFGGSTAASGQQPPSQWGQFSPNPPITSGKDEGLAEARRRGFIK